jgi:hypothetical protein
VVINTVTITAIISSSVVVVMVVVVVIAVLVAATNSNSCPFPNNIKWFFFFNMQIYNSQNVLPTTYATHTVYLCVLCRSQNKHRLFPYTALMGWFV